MSSLFGAVRCFIPELPKLFDKEAPRGDAGAPLPDASPPLRSDFPELPWSSHLCVTVAVVRRLLMLRLFFG